MQKEYIEIDEIKEKLLPEQERHQPWFNMVADKANWKRPVSTIIRLPTTLGNDTDPVVKFMENEIREAVIFYTGSVPQIALDSDEHGQFLRVVADGYYVAIGS